MSRRFLAVLLAVALAAVGFGAGCGGAGVRDGGRSRTATEKGKSKPTIAQVSRRVEDIRGLKFKSEVSPETLGRKEVAKRIDRELDRYTRREQWKDEELLKLLGLLPADASIRRIVRSMFGTEVAGFYDPRRDQLVVIRDGKGSDVMEEIVLSHELVHALEDQRFARPESDDAMADDRETAGTALSEGTAMAVMSEYSKRHINAGAALAAALENPSAGIGSDIPPYVRLGMLFPYEWGEKFVAALRKRGGWRAVNRALRHPPRSTAEIIHPELYLKGAKPATVRSPDVSRILGGRWRKVASAAVGEFDVFAILKLAERDAAAGDAAAGWAGGAVTLWRRGASGPGSCRAPCISRDVGVLSLEFRTVKDGAEFAVEVGPWIQKTFHGKAAGLIGGAPTWTARGGGVAMEFGGRRVTVVFAPDARAAAKVASLGPVAE